MEVTVLLRLRLRSGRAGKRFGNGGRAQQVPGHTLRPIKSERAGVVLSGARASVPPPDVLSEGTAEEEETEDGLLPKPIANGETARVRHARL